MKRNIFSVLLIVIILQSLSGCVSQPRYSDYMGLSQEIALEQLNRKKRSNTVKIVINWLTAGYTTFWIASVVDTIRLISFSGDFRRVEGQITATPSGVLVGHTPAPPPPIVVTSDSVQRTALANTAGLDEKKLDEAINNASAVLAEGIQRDTTIAVLSISATNRNTSEYIIGELEYYFVNTGKFKIVDRKRIDQIRNEQNFQMSGDVSDDSAVSIGNMLGANIVITGEITGAGSNQRLLLKALDVQTAQIISMAREQI
jgi:hypothetical protein